MKKVLAFTSNKDQEYKFVKNYAQKNNISIEFIQLKNNAFIEDQLIGFHISDTVSSLMIQVEDQTFSWDDIDLFWFCRQPRPRSTADEDEHVADIIYREQETEMFWHSLPYLFMKQGIPCYPFTKSPDNYNASALKPLQLYWAKKIGLKIPDTQIGNDVNAGLTFLQNKEQVAVKAAHFVSIDRDDLTKFFHTHYKYALNKFHPNITPNEEEIKDLLKKHNYAYPTNLLSSELIKNNAASIGQSAIIMQDFIPKKADLRIPFVNDKIFPCAIFSQTSEKTKIDYRLDFSFEDNLHHEYHPLPPDVEEKLIQLMAALNIEYGCIDMVLTPDDDYLFLEVNIDGCWVWVEEKTGAPIAQNLIDAMKKKMSS